MNDAGFFYGCKTNEDRAKRYKALSKILHPDIQDTGSNEAFQELHSQFTNPNKVKQKQSTLGQMINSFFSTLSASVKYEDALRLANEYVDGMTNLGQGTRSVLKTSIQILIKNRYGV